MTKPKPANPTLSISDANLTSALAQIDTEIDQQPLRSSIRAGPRMSVQSGSSILTTGCSRRSMRHRRASCRFPSWGEGDRKARCR